MAVQEMKRQSSQLSIKAITLPRPHATRTNERPSFSGQLRPRPLQEPFTKSTFWHRKNKEMHKLFPNLDPDDGYVEDYGCALQKEILLQGRLYLSHHSFCFYANIFGFITNVVIPITSVTRLEKRMTLIFPNAISITTPRQKYFLTSFILRDQAYEKMMILYHQASQQHETTDSSLTLPDTCHPDTMQEQDTTEDTTTSAEEEGKGKEAEKEEKSKEKVSESTRPLVSRDASRQPSLLHILTQPFAALASPVDYKSHADATDQVVFLFIFGLALLVTMTTFYILYHLNTLLVKLERHLTV